MNETSAVCTVPEAAAELGVRAWQVRRLFELGKLPAPPRAGLTRLIRRSDLPRIRQALIAAGYLVEAEAAVAAG
jgi:hypothetical protein